MEKNIQFLQVLYNLIISTSEDMVKINKATLFDIKMHSHQAHETIEFLQLESQLQQDELQQMSDASFNHTYEDKNDDSKSLI